jgi:hypothetical protein
MNNKPKSVIKIDQNHQIIRVKQDDPAEAMLKVKETT